MGSGRTDDRPGGRAFDRAAAERVLRRALEIHDAAHPDEVELLLDEAVLSEAAAELGVDPSEVALAAAEERCGALVGPRRRTDQLVGPGTLVARRPVDLPSDVVLDRADQWLRKVGAFRRQRRGDRGADYSRRNDVAAVVQRGARTMVGHEALTALRHVTVAVEPVGRERSVVALVADLERQRRQTMLAGGSVAGGGTAAASTAALVATPWWWLAVPGTVAAGVGILGARAHALGAVETSLEGAAEWIASGRPLPGVMADLGPTLLGSRVAGAVRSANRRPPAARDAPAPRSPRGPAAAGPRGGGR